MNTILLPRAPKLDKVAALYAYVTYVLKTTLDQVQIIFDNGQPVGPDVIDIDTLQDYKSLGYGSATERVVKEHPELSEVRGMRHFVSLFNLNNATGQLKNRFPDNFFNLINDWPRVPHSCPKSEHLMRIVRELWPVFEAYFTVAETIGERIDQIHNPFCQAGLEQMTGGAAQLHDQLEELFELTEKADQRTTDAALRIKPELEFWVPTAIPNRSMAAAVYRTDDKRMARQLWALNPELGMLIARSREGNYVIFCKGQQDLGALYTALNQLEPGQWHHETRYKSPFIANGSESRAAVPSKLTPSQLRDLICQHVQYLTREQQVGATK